MSRQYRKLVPVSDMQAGRVNGDSPITVAKVAEVTYWEQEPETRVFGRIDVLGHRFLETIKLNIPGFGKRKFDKVEVVLRGECMCYWCDEIMGPQGERQVVRVVVPRLVTHNRTWSFGDAEKLQMMQAAMGPRCHLHYVDW